MVGGDRRSPPRHKAKGGGSKGKGGGSNEGLSEGSNGSCSSVGVKPMEGGFEEFKFGSSPSAEITKFGPDLDGKYLIGATVKDLYSDHGVHCDSLEHSKSVDKLAVKAGNGGPKSWAMEVEALEKSLCKSHNMDDSPSTMKVSSMLVEAHCTSSEENRDHGTGMECGGSSPTAAISHGVVCESLDYVSHNMEGCQLVNSGKNGGANSTVNAYVKTGLIGEGNSALCVIAGSNEQETALNTQPKEAEVRRHRETVNGTGSSVQALECSNLQRGEDLLLSKEGNLKMLQEATNHAQARNLDSHTANMDCVEMPSTLNVSLCGVNYNVSDWMSKNSGEIGGANSSNLHKNHVCTQGVRSIASTGQGAENTYVNSRFLGKTVSAINSSSLPHKAATNSLGNDLTRGLIVNSVTSFQKPNAWKRIGHHKINLQELGTITENSKSVCFDENAYERNKGRLDKGLVGKLIGRKLPLHILDQELSRRWSHVGGFRTILVGGDCFLCIFESMEARDNILMGGPWLIMGHLIGMDRWSSEFDPRSLSGLTSPDWVRLPKLPLLYWDNITIGRIAAMIGEPLWIDGQTTEWGRSEYARVCVRLDLSKSLPTGVWIQGKKAEFFQPVEYEGISLLCFHCGVVGHKAEVCRHKTTTSPSKTSPGIREATPMKDHQMDHSSVNDVGGCSTIEQTMNQPFVEPIMACDSTFVVDPDEGSRYGPWILVSRKRKTLPKQRPLATMNQPTTVQMSYKAKKDATVSSPMAKPITGEAVQEPMVVESVTKPHGIEEQVSSEATVLPLAPIGSSPLHEAVMPSVSLEVTPSHQPNNRSGKSRVSRAHFEKELLQLGPIALKSRKRKKQVSVAGLQQGLKEITNKEGTVQNDCGGDASPSSGK